MASIRLTIPVARPASEVWAAIADVGAVHERLARGFVVDTQLRGRRRLVTFDNGLMAHELIVDLDDDARRIAYAVVESPLGFEHHHATMEVFADGDGRSHLLWVADMAPDDVGASIDEFMRSGAAAIRRTLSGVTGTRF